MGRRPNIIWITTDQHRHDGLGCAGNPVLRTPHLDRLAAEGVRFDRAYTVSPLCAPARASMITGRYPRAHGTWHLGVPLPAAERTLAHILQAEGYRTALFGKCHLGCIDQPYAGEAGGQIESLHRRNGAPPEVVDRFWSTWAGPYYGFEHVAMVLHHGDACVGGGHYDHWLRRHHPEALEMMSPAHALAPLTGAEQSWKSGMPPELHYNVWIAERAEAFLAEQGDQPFFAWVNFPDPHHPFNPPAPYCDLYDPAAVPAPLPERGELGQMPPHYQAYYEGKLDRVPYLPDRVAGAFAMRPPLCTRREATLREVIAHTYGMITFVDEAVGRILRALDRLDLTRDTIVLFNADHGELLGDHGLLLKGPFFYESVIRVPAIMRWPGHLPGGRVYSGLVSLVDLVPTLLAALGVPQPQGVQGESLWPAVQFRQSAGREYALVEHRESPRSPAIKCLITSRYKLTYYPGLPFGELFDLEADRDEYWNLWHDPGMGEVRQQLLGTLLGALCATEDPLPERIAFA